MSNRTVTVPDGFSYHAEFVTAGEERALLAAIAPLTFNEVRMHGVVARRRTLHYGWLYGYEKWSVRPGPPIPDFLLPLRDRLAALVALDPPSFEEALITEYRPGATIGWHRDAPMFGAVVVGVSLVAACRMRFRREAGEGTFERAAIVLEPRSAYVLSGAARSVWQHSIPPADALRYSITFRTVRARRDRRTDHAGPPHA